MRKKAQRQKLPVPFMIISLCIICSSMILSVHSVEMGGRGVGWENEEGGTQYCSVDVVFMYVQCRLSPKLCHHVCRNYNYTLTATHNIAPLSHTVNQRQFKIEKEKRFFEYQSRIFQRFLSLFLSILFQKN